jgi:oligoendopeptidase F
MIIRKNTRCFVDEGLEINSWEIVQPYFQNLKDRVIESVADFNKWLEDKSELDAVIEEDSAWRYIKMTIDTRDENLSKNYSFFVSEIQPQLAPFEDALNQKMMSCHFVDELSSDKAHSIFFRSVKKALSLYREVNIPLEAELSEQSQVFGTISAAQTIEYNGEMITMQKASTYLKHTDEDLRKLVYDKMTSRKNEDVEKLDILYSELVIKRHQLALNAGFPNYRDYMFEALGRFDYSKEDCFNFHQSIKEHIVPLVRKIQQNHKKKLGKKELRPWDLDVDADKKEALKPFLNGDELLQGTINIFDKIDPYFGNCLKTMSEMEYLDLDSKEGKSPGGYNYLLYEVGVPFIFMNAVGTQNDLVTMVHEGGHAVHSFLSRDLKLTGFKNLPSEVAELASMSMELLTMNYWGEFYKEEDQLKRAKREQLQTVLKILPWIATVDEFQHWVYENPNHTVLERTAKWSQLSEEYGTGVVNWEGYEKVKETTWQKQLHLFEVPFYYIEYGIAQLGALGIWKNSQVDFQKTIADYKTALSLGYTKSIPEIYEVAGVKFDFSSNNLKELALFIECELEKLQ